MELLSKILLPIHIMAGFCSIIIFWLPMITKKGSKIHILSGKLYVKSMWIVTITAFLLCVKNLILENYNSAIFLGFLTLITAAPLWHGIAILNFKKQPDTPHQNKLFVLNLLTLIFAIFMILYNTLVLQGEFVLMYIFGVLGLTAAPDVIRRIKNKPNSRNRIQYHAIGMITTAIAAYTAFFAFGGRTFFGKVFTGHLMIIPWVLPGIMGTVGNFYYGKKYASK